MSPDGRALILGVGRMGKAIAYAMSKMNYHVVGMDTNPEAAENMPKCSEKSFLIVSGVEEIIKGLESQAKFDVVISSLPYHQTEKVAFWCIDNGVRYCDLGGRVDVSRKINEYGKEKATKPIFTDLGLAPGWVNIVAEQGYKQVHAKVDSVKMMVGGIPAIPEFNPPLNYAATWSLDGLINEYKDDCEILYAGGVQTVKGMDGLEKVEFKMLNDFELEAFFTSGGASHSISLMQNREVENCSYKTIRYKGHRDVVKMLIRDAELPRESLEKIFVDACPNKAGDIVLIKVQICAGDLTWDKEILVGYDTEFSAMQKATAFSISSVADLMAQGKFDDRKVQNRSGDISLPVVLNYSDVPCDEFNENLKFLGIQV